MIRFNFCVFAVFCIFVLSSCSKSINDIEIFTPCTYNVSGKVEKGPFISGSTITIQPMDSKMQISGNMFNTTITSNLGNFTFGSREFQSPYVEMMATGYFFNEVRGSLSEGTLALRALVDLSDNSTANVNILTHLKYSRILRLIESGKSFKEANTQAQYELFKAFGLQKYASKDASQFSIVAGTDESAALIAVSSLLLNNRSEGELTEYLSTLSQEFSSNGDFSLTTRTQMESDKFELANMLADIKENVIKRYSDLGMDIEVKDLMAYFDWDDDGIAGNETLKPGETISLDKTEILVSKEGGTYQIAITSPIPVYIKPLIDDIPDSIVSSGSYLKDFYEGDSDVAPAIEKLINNNVLSINVAPSQLKKEQAQVVNLYDALGHIVASVNIKIEGNSQSDIPLLGNDSKMFLVSITSYLAEAFSKYNYLEQLYFYNKSIHALPLSASDAYVTNCWNRFFIFNSNLLKYKEIDAQRLGVYQDYINVFYAMYYNTMVVAWGDVPYNFGNSQTDNRNVSRVDKEEILSDLKIKLTASIKTLEEKKNQYKIDANGLFFVSKDVARIALSNILMYEGKWSEAKPLLSKVMSNDFYPLDNSDDNSIGDNSGNGVIFALQSNRVTSRKNVVIREPAILPLQSITDVYLLSAECEYHLGNTTEANALLSKVISAKGLSVSSEGITGIKEAREKLLFNNAGYFAFLKRNDLAKSVCGIQDYQLLFPIPYGELISNSEMTQNPGY